MNNKDTLFTRLQINDKKKDKKIGPINNHIKKYERFNIVSETGDSIYSPIAGGLSGKQDGQVFVSLDKLEEIVNKIIDQRLGSDY
jgi:hypothetical protein